MIEFTNHLSPEEYNLLRRNAGFTELSISQAERGLMHTTWLIAAREDGQAVGMTRVLFDYGYVAYLADVIVRSDYQGAGIGTQMVLAALAFLKEHTSEGEILMFGLHAAEGKEGFYERFGFKKRPCEGMGAGMVLRWEY